MEKIFSTVFKEACVLYVLIPMVWKVSMLSNRHKM